MPDRAGLPFAEFVAREREGLLQLAVLLEADRADADELLRGVLVSLRARWRRVGRGGDPVREARRLLVRRVLARRSDDGPRTSGWVDDPYAGWDSGRSDDVRRALSELPVATRTAVVLSVWARLTDREVGDLLRSPEDAVRGEVVAGLAPMRAALAPVVTAWHAVGPRLPDDDELRAELTALAEDATATDPAGAQTAAADAERAVAARRRHRWPVAVLAVATAVAVAVTVLVREAPAPVADPPPERAEPAPVDTEQVDVAALPTRGPLADDRDFLAGLLRRPWENEMTSEYPIDVVTTEDSRRVLYAGDVPSGRWALVVGRPEPVDPAEEGIGQFFGDELWMTWFTGPRGAEPQDMVMATYPYGLMPGMVPALLDPPNGTLVVVAAPGDAVEVSPRVEVDADGEDSRTWAPVDTVDGIAVANLDPVNLPWTWAVNYRVFRDGGLVSASPPDGMMSTDLGLVMPDFGIRYPGGVPSEAGRRAADWAAFIGLSALGAPTDDMEITARVVQPVPGGKGTAALVTITLPSGAFLISAQWAWNDREDFPGGDCGLDVRPADPPPDERLLVAACEMFDPAEGRALGAVLVASTPPGVAAVRLYRGDGTFLEELAVTDRTVVAPMPEGTRTVEAVTADGVLLGRSQLLGHWSPVTD